jgi:hypothetical protein
MEPSVEKTPKQNGGSGIVFGSMAILYALVCLCLGGYVYIFRQQIPVIQNYFPTMTSTPTATPITHQPSSGDQVFKDDFANNKNDWYGDTSLPTRVEVIKGEMHISTEGNAGPAFVYCRFCPTLKSPYYLQADFSTDRATDEPYGIGFSSEEYHATFYFFEINSTSKAYDFYKFTNRDWTLRTSRKSDLIKPYPKVNTLGVSIDHDLITLYINEQIVDTYEDTGDIMSSGTFWPYVDRPGVIVIVDNFYGYGK